MISEFSSDPKASESILFTPDDTKPTHYHTKPPRDHTDLTLEHTKLIPGPTSLTSNIVHARNPLLRNFFANNHFQHQLPFDQCSPPFYTLSPPAVALPTSISSSAFTSLSCDNPTPLPPPLNSSSIPNPAAPARVSKFTENFESNYTALPKQLKKTVAYPPVSLIKYYYSFFVQFIFFF